MREAVIIVLWWIAIWGLIDLLIEGCTRRVRVFFYTGLLAFVSIIFTIEPHILERL